MDAEIRRHVYDATLRHGVPPTVRALAAVTGRVEEDVRAALARLAAARMLVLQRASGEILMAPPFSAVPTPFVVRTPQHDSYANCAWDALGVPVMMRTSAAIESACACCGEAIRLATNGEDTPHGDAALIHFAVPARRWWEDIVFT